MKLAKIIPLFALALVLGAGAAHAQTTSTGTTGTTGVTTGATTGTTATTPAATTDTTTTTSTGTATPGAPNTGAGGDVTENAIILAVSGIVALVGATYFLRTRTN